jgi:hypothetical protein
MSYQRDGAQRTTPLLQMFNEADCFYIRKPVVAVLRLQSVILLPPCVLFPLAACGVAVIKGLRRPKSQQTRATRTNVRTV